MAEREININNKIHGIYDNLKNIKRLLKESEGHLNKQVFSRKIQEHNEENLRFIQELNQQGVTNEEIQRRLQEVPHLMRNDYSQYGASSCLPSKMKTSHDLHYFCYNLYTSSVGLLASDVEFHHWSRPVCSTLV